MDINRAKLSTQVGVPPTELNLPVIPTSAYAAALKEYEEMEETDSEGDGLGWWLSTQLVLIAMYQLGLQMAAYFVWSSFPYSPISIPFRIHKDLHSWYSPNIVYVLLLGFRAMMLHWHHLWLCKLHGAIVLTTYATGNYNSGGSLRHYPCYPSYIGHSRNWFFSWWRMSS